MSEEVNTLLLERAAEMLDYYEGTTIAKVIQADLDRDDLESLYMHVCKAEAQAAQEEFESADVY